MQVDRRLLRMAGAARGPLLVTVGLGLGAGVLAVASAWFLAVILDGAFLQKSSAADLRPVFLALIAAAAGRAVLVWLGEIVAQSTASRVKTRVRERLLEHLFALGPAVVEGERAGELATTVTDGVEDLDDYVAHYLPQLALAAGVPLTVLFFVLVRDRLSALVLLATAPVIPLFMWLIGSLAGSLSRRRWQSLSRLGAFFLEIVQGLPTLKSLGRAPDQVAAIRRVTDRFRKTTMEVLRVAFLSAFTLELAATISTAVIAVEVGLRLLHGRLPYLDAIFVLMLAPEFYLPLRRLGASFHTASAAVASAGRIQELLDLRPALRPAGRRTARTELPASAPAIEFREVSFTYPDAEDPTLHRVDLSIAAGECVALVGPSGAGKTTLARLLLRFMDPDTGVVTADGVPLPDIPLPDWRRGLSWVPQHSYLFHDTVAENIRLGWPSAPRAEVEQAARQAHLHALVSALPEGYDTLVGERAGRLSGGEAQRLALARALLDPARLVVLDEPGAHLDPELERQIQDGLDRLLEGRSALIIAHSLAAARRADRVVVLDRGRIVEQGRPEELLIGNGPFRSMAEAARTAS